MCDKRCACYAVRLFISTQGYSESVVAYKDLREFIARLEKAGELKRISAEVDPVLEITEITHRVTRAGGPALLFERPKGSRVPLLINMLGSERRMQSGAGSRRVRRSRRAHSRVPGHAVAAGPARQNQDAAEARGAGLVFPEDGEDGAVQGSDPPRRLFACWNFRSCSAGRRMPGDSSPGRW